MRRSLSAIAVILLIWPAAASAQISTMPTPIGLPMDTGRPVEELERLTDQYNGGKWQDVQASAKKLLDSTRTAAEKGNAGRIADGVDYSKHYVIVTWLATDPFGKTMLARVIVHSPSSKEPFSADLPGVGVGPGDPQVYQVFLSRGLRGKLVSVYASSRDKDPFAEQLPAFVQAVASPLFAAAGAFAGKINPKATPPPRGIGGTASPKPSPPTIGASVAAVGLPFARATIKWKAVAKEPVEVDAFGDDADSFARDVMFAQSAGSTCARSAIGPLSVVVKGAAADPECAGPAATTTACKSRLDTVIAETIGTTKKAEPCATASGDDLEALEQVETTFREFVSTNMTSSAEADITFRNRPLTHWSFGAGSGVLAQASLTLPRVTVNDEALVADPLTRVVTMSFVNWSPNGYDGEPDEVSAAERVRPFFGVTMTPDFGLTTGVNVLLARGIGITFGGVLLFAQGAENDRIGKAPLNPDVPYRISYARGWLLGVSYNFK